MRPTPSFAALLEQFFTQRLMAQRQVSPHTIASYRDTFRLLLDFAQKRLSKPPSALALADLDALLVSAFLDDLEQNRGVIARTRTGHELTKTTQIYLDAHLALKEAALAKVTPFDTVPGRFKPSDKLLQFLQSL